MYPARLLLLLLCGEINTCTSSRILRQFIYNNSESDINGIVASEYCQKNNMTLMTLYDEDDAKFASSASTGFSSVLVGLRVKPGHKNSADPPRCPTKKGGHRNCSEELSFKCDKGSLVEEKLNWCSARQYCQYHFLGDLITDEGETYSSDDMWIAGNMTDDWEWEDGSCSTYRDWAREHQPDEMYGMVNQGNLRPAGSETTATFICSKGNFRIVVVNETKTWEDALDYCDTHHSGFLQITTKEDQSAVEKWLNGTDHKGTFWVGLRQSRVFGFWIWKERMVEYGNWENGTHPEMPLSHPCGVIKTQKEYKWSDHNCRKTLPFICEERIMSLD